MKDDWEIVDMDDIRDIELVTNNDLDEIKANNILKEDIKKNEQSILINPKYKKYIKKSILYLIFNTVKSPHVWINLALITVKTGIENDWRLNILCSGMGLCFIFIKNRSTIYKITKFFF